MLESSAFFLLNGLCSIDDEFVVYHDNNMTKSPLYLLFTGMPFLIKNIVIIFSGNYFIKANKSCNLDKWVANQTDTICTFRLFPIVLTSLSGYLTFFSGLNGFEWNKRVDVIKENVLQNCHDSFKVDQNLFSTIILANLVHMVDLVLWLTKCPFPSFLSNNYLMPNTTYRNYTYERNPFLLKNTNRTWTDPLFFNEFWVIGETEWSSMKWNRIIEKEISINEIQ